MDFGPKAQVPFFPVVALGLVSPFLYAPCRFLPPLSSGSRLSGVPSCVEGSL